MPKKLTDQFAYAKDGMEKKVNLFADLNSVHRTYKNFLDAILLGFADVCKKDV